VRERKRIVRWLALVASVLVLGVLNVVPGPSPAFGFGTSSPPALPSVVAGGFASCGVLADNSIACWGDNTDGQASPPAGQYQEVNLGYDTGCGLNLFGVIRCWGTPMGASPGGNYSHVVTAGGPSSGFGCALSLPFGSITCWGNEDSGRISGAPTGNGFTQLTVGIRYGCALNSASNIVCWGDNTYGQLDIPAGLGTVTQITTGNFTTCVLTAPNNYATCWGRDTAGQVTNTPANVAFTQISAGFNFVCGLRTDQTLQCWGATTGNFGQANPPSGTYTMVSAGTFHACAMPTSGPPAACWGQNQGGRAVPQINDRLPPSNSGTQAPPPGGAVGTPYSYQYLNTYMNPAGTYTLTAGSLPPGLTLSPTGQLSGTPTTPGTYTGTVRVANSLSAVSGQDSGEPITSTEDFSIVITGTGPTTTTSSTIPGTTTTSTTRPATTTSSTIPGPRCNGLPATIVGTPGADRLIGTPVRDVIVGLGGNDSIYGQGADDVICGGDGNDVINGGTENDYIDGGNGDDRVIGDAGNDNLFGGAGTDRVFAGPGMDLLDGGTGFDYCYKGTGTNTFVACEVFPSGM